MPAPHHPEFRPRSADLARSRVNPNATIANELSISESCLRNWLAQDDADEGSSNLSRLSSAEKRELAELRKKTRRLEIENEILKRPLVIYTPARIDAVVKLGGDPRHPWTVSVSWIARICSASVASRPARAGAGRGGG